MTSIVHYKMLLNSSLLKGKITQLNNLFSPHSCDTNSIEEAVVINDSIG